MRTVLLLALLPASALAAPMTLNHQGRVFDATGVPVSGLQDVSVALYDGPTATTAVWTEDHAGSDAVDFDNGYFALTLGELATLDTADLASAEVWVELSVSGTVIGRERIHSVPFAILADTAANLSGGVVDASEIRVGGNVVIDASGNLTSGDTLAGLGCSVAGEVATYDGSAWSCAAVSFSQIGGVPADLLDGDSDTLSGISCGTQGEVLSWDLSVSGWVCGPDATTVVGPHYSDTDAQALIDSHSAFSDAHHARYTDAEVQGFISAHSAFSDAHHARYTDAEVQGFISAHSALADAHHTPYTDTMAQALVDSHSTVPDAHHPRYTDAEAQGAVGPHRVQSAQGLVGDGSGSSPLAPDWIDLPTTSQSARWLEGEGPILASNVATGSVATDATASGGEVRLGTASDGPGRLFGVHNGDLGRSHIYLRRAVVSARLKVADNSSTATLAQLVCITDDGTAWAGQGAVDVVPADFPAADTWMDVSFVCNFRPEDVNQFVGVDGFAPGITDLSVDYLSIDPLPAVQTSFEADICSRMQAKGPDRNYTTLNAELDGDYTGAASCGAGWHVCNATEFATYSIIGGCDIAANAWLVGGFSNYEPHRRALWNGQDMTQCAAGNYPMTYGRWAGYLGRIHCAAGGTARPVACCTNQ